MSRRYYFNSKNKCKHIDNSNYYKGKTISPATFRKRASRRRAQIDKALPLVGLIAFIIVLILFAIYK